MTFKFKCEICNVPISTQNFLDEHLAGQKHREQVEKRTSLETMAARSIYLNNFKQPIDINEVEQVMGQFGEVDRIIPDNSGKNAFAIVEFKEKDAALNILDSIQRIKIGKSTVRIKPRLIDFDGDFLCQDFEKPDQISVDDVLECIKQANSGIINQLNALVSRFAISTDIIKERNEFAQQLEQFIQRYFISTIHIRIFGSTSTGLGFYNSDLDLNMVFEEDLQQDAVGNSINFPNSPEVSFITECHNDHVSMDSQETSENLLKNPLNRTAFMRLSKIDRIRLLNRLMNILRKEKALITTHVPVPDARTPVLRLLLRNVKRTPCELSVQNLLSECKANLVRDIVRAETTGVLWRLLFILKLWATANGLFKREDSNLAKQKRINQRNRVRKNCENDNVMHENISDHPGIEAFQQDQQQAHPKSAWNSYIFSLCTIAFLQNKQLLPSIEQLIRPNSRKINGWAIEYDMPFFKLNDDIPNLLKGLFIFIYQQLKEDRVIMPRIGGIIDGKLFKQNYMDNLNNNITKSWRFSSVVNVQDPLELSHNVAANVSKESLTKLRWKVMYGISVIKKSPDNFLERLFHLDHVRQLQQERRAEKSHNREIAAKMDHQVSTSSHHEKDEEMDVDEN